MATFLVYYYYYYKNITYYLEKIISWQHCDHFAEIGGPLPLSAIPKQLRRPRRRNRCFQFPVFHHLLPCRQDNHCSHRRKILTKYQDALSPTSATTFYGFPPFSPFIHHGPAHMPDPGTPCGSAKLPTGVADTYRTGRYYPNWPAVLGATKEDIIFSSVPIFWFFIHL